VDGGGATGFRFVSEKTRRTASAALGVRMAFFQAKPQQRWTILSA
jgi:hypothetical protein